MRTIRRAALVAGVLAAGSLGAATPASADFHPACTGFSGDAFLSLKTEGSEFVYAMSVTCQDADSITIKPLTLRNFFGSVDFSSDTEPGKTCAGSSCSVTGRMPTGLPGLYRLSGQFSATGNGHTFTDVPRCATYSWFGSGDPVLFFTHERAQTC